MRNPYFACRPPRVLDAHKKSAEQLLQETGLNTGNLLFISSLNRTIKNSVTSHKVGFNPAEVQEKHDCIVIPAANWLNFSSDFGGLASLIEATHLPCFIIGLGAQSFDRTKYPDVTKGTRRLIEVAAERCHSISVRGEYTAEVLNHLGVKNVTVTGCPSLLWRISTPAQVIKPAKRITSVAVNGTRSEDAKVAFAKDSKSRIGILLSRLAYRSKYDYVAQTELNDMKVAMAELSGAPLADALQFLGNVYEEPDGNKLNSYLRSHLKIFSDVQKWIAFLATRDLTIGTRLHGAIASLLAGKPAVLVTHDTRTIEMANEARIPYINGEDLLTQPDFSLQKLYDSLDFSEFNRRQAFYYNRFHQYFDDNKIEHNLSASAEAPYSSRPTPGSAPGPLQLVTGGGAPAVVAAKVPTAKATPAAPGKAAVPPGAPALTARVVRLPPVASTNSRPGPLLKWKLERPAATEPLDQIDASLTLRGWAVGNKPLALITRQKDQVNRLPMNQNRRDVVKSVLGDKSDQEDQVQCGFCHQIPRSHTTEIGFSDGDESVWVARITLAP